ncbi:cell adhesion molecule DSCAM-like [Ptychodera flava]|uniref:cell adhesion molecule DSCAM-like n=1 Tax=Ptychodera flava TaxID=63121 RepID=UPI003969CA4C
MGSEKFQFENPQDAAPEIISSVASKTVTAGGRVELPCVSTAYPQPSPAYQWFRGRRAVTMDDRVKLLGGNLVIEGAVPEDSGRYTCESENDLASTRIQTILTVTEPLSVYFDPQHQTIDVGSPTSFNCSVSGSPVTGISWLKNAKPLEEDERVYTSENETTLIVTWVTREDKGMYQCFVSNSREAVEATVQLTIGAALPVVLDSFEEQTLQPGPNVQLSCKVAGNPLPNVTWTLDGLSLWAIDNGRLSVGEWINEDGDVISHVNITGISVMDGGLWRCQATSEIGEAHYEARINVLGNPVVRAMPNVTAVSGRDTTINCRVAGYPIESIEWRKNGDTLPTNLRQTVLSDGTLIIASTEKGRDEGEYSCIATNPLGTASRKKVFVTVRVPPEIDPFEFPTMLRQGDRTQFPCVVSKGDMPITITWKKDGRPIPEGIGISITNTNLFSSTLSIGDVSPHHEGNYTCVVRNDAAKVTYTSELIVLVPPRFVSTPKDSSVILNKAVTIPCSAAGAPTPTIQWKKAVGPGASNFVALPTYQRIRVSERGSLTIIGAQKEDSGYYLCHIGNIVGSDSKTAMLTVYIPAYFESHMETKEVRKTEAVTLTCEVKGHRPITVDWKKNGELYTNLETSEYQIRTSNEGDIVVSTMKILETKRGDTANYTCHAANGYGSDVKQFNLVVQEPPETPTNLSAINRGSRSTTIAWQPGFDGNTPLTGYTLEYKNDSDAWQGGLPHLRVEPNETSHTITGLHPYYTYNVRIYAFNAVGVSQASKDTIFTTLQEAPSGPPLNVELEAASSQSILVRWRQPRADQQNGVLEGYHIGYQEFNTSSHYLYRTVNVQKRRNGQEFTVEKLKKFTKYSIVVQAFNSIGAGPRTDPKVIMTQEDVPSQAPVGVQAMPLSSTGMKVLWGTPPLSSLNGILQGYKVIYKPIRDDEDETQTFVQQSKGLFVNIYGLEKFTNYSFEVLAYTRVGDGVKSFPIYEQTEEDVPDEPADIKAHAVSPTSIMVSWQPPIYPNGILESYTIFIRHREGNEVTEELLLKPPPAILYHTITNLQTNFEYDFWVMASTNRGRGQPSRIVTEILLERVAARISSFPLILTTPWKQDVELPCVAVGDPLPTVQWKKNRLTTPIEPSEQLQIFQNGSLYIKTAKSLDAGNYTCKAANKWGTDEITVQLKVQVKREGKSPPKAPHLTVAYTTMTSIQVNWTSGSNGGSPIKGFRLFYKRDHGQWENMRVNLTERSYRLAELSCGTPYKFFLVAYNSIGEGDHSSIIDTRTDGSAPIAPRQSQFLKEVNSTSVTINLQSWQTGGCPIRGFTVQYKFSEKDEWTLVANDIPASEDFFVIEDLRPATHYNLRVTSYNAAGPSAMETSVATLKYDGSTVPPMILHLESKGRGLLFYEDPRIIVPIFVVVTFLIIGIMALVCGFKTRWKSKLVKRSLYLAALNESGVGTGFGGPSTLNGGYRDPANRGVNVMPTAENEPFLLPTAVMLNNSPSGESTDSRPEADRPRPWVYKSTDPEESQPLQAAAMPDKNKATTSQDMHLARPSGSVPLSTFHSLHHSEESIYASASDDGNISSSGIQLQEACYLPSPSRDRSPNNHTYASVDEIAMNGLPPLPKRPKELSVAPSTSTFVKHRGSPFQDKHRHSVASTETTSSTHEELTKAFDDNGNTEHMTSMPYGVPHDPTTQSDMDNGIRHFTASPPYPYVPERRDSRPAQQPAYANAVPKGSHSRQSNVNSRRSSDGSEIEMAERPQVAVYRQPRHRPHRRHQRKGAQVVGRPVIRASRGPSRRQKRGESSGSSSSSSPTEDMAFTTIGDNLSSPSEGYLSYQCDSRTGTLGSGLPSVCTDSDNDTITPKHSSKSRGGSVSEPERSRRPPSMSTFRPRPSKTPIPMSHYHANSPMPSGDNIPMGSVGQGQQHWDEPCDLSPLRSSSPPEGNEEIEIHMLSEPALKGNTRGYKEEYTIV